MTRSLLSLVLVPALGTVAYAQAPGEGYAQPPGETAPVAPVVVVAPAPPINPMADRFAIGLQVGGGGYKVHGAPEQAEDTSFNMAELDIRFRATPRLEVFLAFAGGRQVLEDDRGEQTDGDLAMDQITLGLRFNFRPWHHWNWYLMGGFGSTLIAPHDTPEEQRDDLRRPHAMFGIGVEHRWNHFALQAELRGVHVGQNEDQMDKIQPAIGSMEIDGAANQELGGGQFTLGANYYF